MDAAKCRGGELTEDDRKRLAESCFAWAQNIARKYAVTNNVPPSIRDDLISHAMIGLCEAVAHYDPMRGAAFRSFAYRRIIGAIIDFLRREYPQGYRRAGKKRYASEDVPATYHFSQTSRVKSCSAENSLDDPGTAGDNCDLSDSYSDGSDPIGWELEFHDYVEYLASTMTEAGGAATLAWLAMFTRADKSTMKSAGNAVGVTEGRVSQFCKFAREALAQRARTIAATQGEG